MEALQNAASKVELEPAPGMGNLIKITTQFRDRERKSICFLRLHTRKRKKIFLTDAGLILGTLQKSGMGLQLGLVQSLLRTYGLMFTQEGVVIDQSDRSIEERVDSSLPSLVRRRWRPAHLDPSGGLMADKMYQIRRKSDGLYSTGGTWPSFNTVGKIWTRPGSLKNHVVMVNQQFKRIRSIIPTEDCGS